MNWIELNIINKINIIKLSMITLIVLKGTVSRDYWRSFFSKILTNLGSSFNVVEKFAWCHWKWHWIHINDNLYMLNFYFSNNNNDNVITVQTFRRKKSLSICTVCTSKKRESICQVSVQILALICGPDKSSTQQR